VDQYNGYRKSKAVRYGWLHTYKNMEIGRSISKDRGSFMVPQLRPSVICHPSSQICFNQIKIRETLLLVKQAPKVDSEKCTLYLTGISFQRMMENLGSQRFANDQARNSYGG